MGGNSDLVLTDEGSVAANVTVTGGTVIGNRSSLFIVDEPGDDEITLDGDLECVLYVEDESEPATAGYTRGIVSNIGNANVSGRVIGCQGGP